MKRQSLVVIMALSLTGFGSLPGYGTALNISQEDEDKRVLRSFGSSHIKSTYRKHYGKGNKRYAKGYHSGFRRGFYRGLNYGRHYGNLFRRNGQLFGYGNQYFGGLLGGVGRVYGGQLYGGNGYVHAGNVWHNRISRQHVDRYRDDYTPYGYGGYAGYPSSSTRQFAGTVLGGVLGGAIGAEIDGGQKRLVGTAIGSAVGAALGNEVARDLDERDRYYNDGYRHFQRPNTVHVIERGNVTSINNGTGQKFEATPGYHARSPEFIPQYGVEKCVRYQYLGGDYQCVKWAEKAVERD